MTAGRRDHLPTPAITLRERSERDFDAAAAGIGLEPAFQPIVSLLDGAIVGFEALARWPGLHGCTPDRVFRHAAGIGAVDTLDQLCIDAAISAALCAPMSQGTLLCINAEPSTPYVGRAHDAILARGHDELTLMFEITERSILAHPRALLRKLSAMRSDGFAIAMDDVGAQADSLPLLDIILPDVIKLDLALVQTRPTHGQARTLAAVLAHHERTQAVILAEGIETHEHLEHALALGATLGQGFLFGRPGPLGAGAAQKWVPSPRTRPHDFGTGLPFDLVARSSPVRTARKETLIALSRHIEAQARHAVDPPMVFTALQRHEFYSDVTQGRYRDLAGTCPLVAVFGHGIRAERGSGIRAINLDPGDPLCNEWTVITLGPHTAIALIAREHADDDEDAGARCDADRRFDFVITYDRPLVSAVVQALLDRIQ